MHKKSLEAAEKLKEEEGDDIDIMKDGSTTPGSVLTSSTGSGNPVTTPEVNKEELRSESIAQLRAKAQSYQAKIREAVTTGNERLSSNHGNSNSDVYTHAQRGSGFEPPPRQTDTCDSDSLDPTN